MLPSQSGALLPYRTSPPQVLTARAGNRRFRLLSSLRAHTKAPCKMDFHTKTRSAIHRPGAARTVAFERASGPIGVPAAGAWRSGSHYLVPRFIYLYDVGLNKSPAPVKIVRNDGHMPACRLLMSERHCASSSRIAPLRSWTPAKEPA